MAVPFTTPLLAGGRVRQSSRSQTELVVPNSSGHRGVCIVAWSGARELCNPTLHDRMLIQRIAPLKRIDPATVREVSRAVVLDGYAGRDAAAAAAVSCDNDEAQRRLAHFLLSSELIERIQPAGRKPALLAERTSEFDRRLALALHQIAASLGCTAMSLGAGLTELAIAFAPVGFAWNDETARIPRMIRLLDDTRLGLSQWLGGGRDTDLSGLGQTVAAMMQATSGGAASLLAQTRALLMDPAALLKRWLADAGETLGLVGRCDWLLDGWEWVCLLWKMAGSEATRRASLLEMTQVLPVLPREITDWVRAPIPSGATDPHCRVTSQNDRWRRGAAAFALIQRNEALRAMSV